MITKKFENYKESIKSKTYYIIIDMGDDIDDTYTLLFDNKESAYNWVRNYVHQIFESEANEVGEYDYICKNEFDPYELLDLYNDKYGTQNGRRLFLKTTTLQPEEKLNKHLELQMSTKKYNL